MNDDMEAIDGLYAKIIEQRRRIEALEAEVASLREANKTWVDMFGPAPARAALAPEQKK